MSDLRIDLVLPLLRLGVGPFSFDPIEHLVGAKVADLLAPLLSGPITIRRSEGHPDVEIYPLRLPDGEGASLSLGQLGELGFQNEGGQLLLRVPRPAARWVSSRLGASLVDGPREEVVDGVRIACFTVSLCRGMRASWPMGSLGEVGIEVAEPSLASEPATESRPRSRAERHRRSP